MYIPASEADPPECNVDFDRKAISCLNIRMGVILASSNIFLRAVFFFLY